MSTSAAAATQEDTMTVTADQHRTEARLARERASESWDRSDTDGFMSQWANGLSAAKHELEAEVADNGGQWTFPALFTLAGDLIDARLVQTRYGMAWVDTAGRWYNPSRAQDPARERAANARKGFYVGVVKQAAFVDYRGESRTSVRPCILPVRDAARTVVDNGITVQH